MPRVDNKRDRLMALLETSGRWDYIPAAFFMHFGWFHRHGSAAARKHLEFFRHTDMDFLKIQFEQRFPRKHWMRANTPWDSLRLPDLSLFDDALSLIRMLVKEAGRETLVIQTLKSPYFCLRQMVGTTRLDEALTNQPQSVHGLMQRMTDLLLAFRQRCTDAGVDGFYFSTQGGEAGRFSDRGIFERHIKPHDLALLTEIEQSGPLNILHICDFHGSYDDLTPYLDYPGQVVNCGLDIGSGTLSCGDISDRFDRPFLGGMYRNDRFFSKAGSADESAVRRVLESAPDRFILGADCTVPMATPWKRLASAIRSAHEFRAS